LKTNLDFQLHVIASASNEDFTRYVNLFRVKLVTQMGEYFRSILNNTRKVDDETYRTVSNIRLNASIDKFNEAVVKMLFDRILHTSPKSAGEPREYYRKYLTNMLLSLRPTKEYQMALLINQIDQATSRKVNHQEFIDFLFHKVIKEIILQELKTVIN
jgi:hypothetical protein